MTSITTIIVMIPMVIMAGEAIREFVLPLMVGIIAGTYSSICVCSPLYYELGRGDSISEYQKQVRGVEKEARKKAKSGRKYPGIVKADQKNQPEGKVREPLAETAAEAEAPVANNKTNVNKKRSKRYVKGNQNRK